jgi:hypothetical protein
MSFRTMMGEMTQRKPFGSHSGHVENEKLRTVLVCRGMRGVKFKLVWLLAAGITGQDGLCSLLRMQDNIHPGSKISYNTVN